MITYQQGNIMKTITQLKAECKALRAEYERALGKLEIELKAARARSGYKPVVPKYEPYFEQGRCSEPTHG
jgi:hypothetical protein